MELLKLNQIENVLENVQERDNNLYRVYFEASPIPIQIHEIRHDLSGTLIRDGMFSMPAKGLTVYAHKKDDNTSIDGILVHDNRDTLSTVTYSAEKGYLINENNSPKLHL